MSVVKTITTGLCSAATTFVNSSPADPNARRRLQVVALRFAAGKLVATGESGTASAAVLLEQLAQETESLIKI